MGDTDCASGACRATRCVATWFVGLTVSGLPPGNAVTLANGSDQLEVRGDGSFVFRAKVTGAYNVTVAVQPGGATCTVTNGAGTATADVSNVQVTCTPRYAISGTVSGLPPGQGVELRNLGADAVTVTGDGPFTFPTRVSGPYAVTVQTQPMGARCEVTAGSGTATADVSNVTVACASAWSLGGTVSGLTASETVSLRNATDVLSVSANGPFTFGALVTGAYDVRVDQAPPGKACVVVNGVGVATGAVTTVAVLCGGSGTLDTTFGGTGWYSSARGTGSDFFTRGHLNPDGSMVLAGRAEVGPGSVDWLVARLRADGTVDTSFGTAGFTLIGTGVGIEAASGLFPDGTGFLVVGSLFGTNPDVGIARITAAGVLDTSFGTNGTTRHDNGNWEYFEDAVRDAMGRIVVVGRQSLGGAGPHDIVVTRLNPNGTLDTTFATNGWFVTGGPGDESGTSVTIDPTTQDVIAAGTSGSSVTVVRLNAQGVPVATFGTAGIATIDLSGAGRSQWVYRVVTAGTGFILVGRADGPSTSDLAVVKLTATGAFDSTFATGGRLLVDRGRGEVGYSISPAPLGGFYVGGHSDSFMLVTRISASGTIDSTFGSAGFFENVLSNSSVAYHLMIDTSSRVVAVGTIRVTGSEDVGVARLLP